MWANASAMGQRGEVAPGIPSFPDSSYGIPWLSYLSKPLAAGIAPPPGLLSERTPDGGLLMITTQDRLDPTDPEQMRRSHAIADIMIARAGIHGYDMGGVPWPKPQD
jgi:hypothetical protein